VSVIRTTDEDRASPYGRVHAVQDSFDRDGAAIISIKALVKEEQCLVRLPNSAGLREYIAEVGHFVGDHAQVMLKIEGLPAVKIPVGSLIEIIAA